MNRRFLFFAWVLVPFCLLAQLALWPDMSASREMVGQFDSEQVARSAAYGDFRYLWFIYRALAAAALLLLLSTRTISHALRVAVDAPGRHPVLTGTLVSILCCIAVQSQSMALGFKAGYLHELEWGFTNQTVAAWVWDALLGRLIGLAYVTAAMAAILFMARRFGRIWWAPSAAFVMIGTVLVLTLQPLVLDPLFDNYTPLAGRPGAEALEELAVEAGVDPSRMSVAETSHRSKKLNAFINGFGPTLRIAFWDTLLDRSRQDEVELVLAHELGHWHHDHVQTGTLIALLGILAMFVVLGGIFPHPEAEDVPALLFTIWLVMMASLPAQNHISRTMETQADWYALELTERFDAYVSAEETLARENLSYLNPPSLAVWFLYTHPPVADRIRMGQERKPPGMRSWRKP